jgi:hypothetical protein
MMGCALAMTLGFVLALAAPARAQQPGVALSPDTEAPPPNRGRISAEFINWELGGGLLRLQRALAMQTNGTTPDPEQTAKTIYEGYVKIRSAHALLMRRMEKRNAKTGIPDPTLGLAFNTIRKARFSVLYARQAAAKSQTEQSVGYLTTAIAGLERARALID